MHCTLLRATVWRAKMRLQNMVWAGKPKGLKRPLLWFMRLYEFYRAGQIDREASSGQGWFDLYRQTRKLEKTYLKRPHPSKRTVVFAIHLLSCFSAVESIYRAAALSDWNAILLLMPGRQPGMDKKWAYDNGLIEAMEGYGYPYELAYSDGQWHSILEWQPDVLFFQTPYFRQRHPLYNFKYALAGPRVCYTPYGPWIMDRSLKDYINISIDRPYFDGLWKIYADKMTADILRDEAPQYMPVTVVSGTPKVDFHRMPSQSTAYCWNLPKSEEHKRLIWMPRWGIEEDRSSFPVYYEYFLYLARHNAHLDFVFRPHPLLFRDIVRSGYMSKEKLDTVIQAFESLPNAGIDYDNDYRAGVLSCDFIISDYSSIIYESLPSLKPVIYTRKKNALMAPSIQAGCYCVDSLDDMEKTISLLLNGADPLQKQRAKVVENLAYFTGERLNGEHVFRDIANSFATEGE